MVGALIPRSTGPTAPRPGGDPYASMVRSILFQQLAGAAARAIQRRFFALHGDEERTPEPLAILATSDKEFRGAGVSRQKAGYLRDLAQHCVDGALDFAAIAGLDDAAVIERLTAVRGIGEWSAHMFLMFELGRPDVLPTGDLGVRKGMQAAYGLPETPTPKQGARDRRALGALPHRRLLVHVARRRDDHAGGVSPSACVHWTHHARRTRPPRPCRPRRLRGRRGSARLARTPRTCASPSNGSRPKTASRGSRSRRSTACSHPHEPALARPSQPSPSGRGGRAALKGCVVCSGRWGAWGALPPTEQRIRGGWAGPSRAQRVLVRAGGVGPISPAKCRTRGASPRGPALPLPRPCAGTGPRLRRRACRPHRRARR